MDGVQVLPNPTLKLMVPLRFPLITFLYHTQNQSMKIQAYEFNNEKEMILPTTTAHGYLFLLLFLVHL